MSTTFLKEIFGVRKMLGDPLDQAPSTRQIADELDLELQQLLLDASNRGLAQHVGELVIDTVAGQRRYEIGAPEFDTFYKALSVSTIPEGAVVTGDYANKRVTVSGGDDRMYDLELVDMDKMNADWAFAAPNRGQLFTSNHDAQQIAFFKVIDPTVGEKLVVELRPTPNAAQQYLLTYQMTDVWDTLLGGSTDGVTDANFKIPHPSQRGMVRCRVALNLIGKGVTKWALNDRYNLMRGKLVKDGLTDRYERYKQTYDDYLDELEHGDVVYIELYGDRL